VALAESEEDLVEEDSQEVASEAVVEEAGRNRIYSIIYSYVSRVRGEISFRENIHQVSIDKKKTIYKNIVWIDLFF
jgi:hypothetical protein